jgi:hypothetical protein
MLPEVLPLCLQVLFTTVQVLFFRVMRLIAFQTQFTSVLHPGSLVSFSYTIITNLYHVDCCLILTK